MVHFIVRMRDSVNSGPLTSFGAWGLAHVSPLRNRPQFTLRFRTASVNHITLATRLRLRNAAPTVRNIRNARKYACTVKERFIGPSDSRLCRIASSKKLQSLPIDLRRCGAPRPLKLDVSGTSGEPTVRGGGKRSDPGPCNNGQRDDGLAPKRRESEQ